MNTLDIDILRALRAASQFGLAVDDLLADMRRGRHRELTKPELESALRDLADKSLSDPIKTVLGSKRWCITALGGQALREEGL